MQEQKRYMIDSSAIIRWWTYVGDRNKFDDGHTVKQANRFTLSEPVYTHGVSKIQARNNLYTKLTQRIKKTTNQIYVWPHVSLDDIKED